jgi:hypothetical protein
LPGQATVACPDLQEYRFRTQKALEQCEPFGDSHRAGSRIFPPGELGVKWNTLKQFVVNTTVQ